METIFQICLSNSLVALALAALAAGAAARKCRPAFVHALWVLVLIKLVTPPLLRVPLSPGSVRDLVTRARTVVAPIEPAHSSLATDPGKLRDYYTWRYSGHYGALLV